MDKIKKQKKAMGEDEGKRQEKQVQLQTDEHTKMITTLLEGKQSDILTGG